jgi:hypothetical protein
MQTLRNRETGTASGAGLTRRSPAAARPATAQPDTARPDTARPDTAQPDTAQPDTAQPAAADRTPSAERRRRRARFLAELAEARQLRERVTPRRTRRARLREALRMQTFRW